MEKGWETRQIGITKWGLSVLGGVTDDDSFKQMLAGQTTHWPKFLYTEIGEVSLSHDFSGVYELLATVKIRRGHDILAKFVKGHSDHAISITSDGEYIFIQCECGDLESVRRDSLGGVYETESVDSE